MEKRLPAKQVKKKDFKKIFIKNLLQGEGRLVIKIDSKKLLRKIIETLFDDS